MDSRSPSPDLPSSPPALPSTFPRRKRARIDYRYDENTSSDPPVFSSDDGPEASIDNYVTPRKKKQYRGTWWDHQPVAKASNDAAAKMDLTRNVDSGVWMGSDGTDDSAASAARSSFGADTTMLEVPDLPDEVGRVGCRAIAMLSPTASKLEAVTEGLARQIIEQCLDDGKEMVDLSDLSLTAISDATLRPLHALIRAPRAADALLDSRRSSRSDSDLYAPFTPSLQLFLSRNSLRSLPRELWNLQTLTVLSLRNNALTEIPSAIANLRNLKELNLAGNRLRWLPWELLGLVASRGPLQRLTVLPNPFVQGTQFHGELAQRGHWRFPANPQKMEAVAAQLRLKVQLTNSPGLQEQFEWLLKLHEVYAERMRDIGDSNREDNWFVPKIGVDYPLNLWKEDPVHLASTSVAFFTFDGRLERHSPPPPSTTPEDTRFLPSAIHHTSTAVPHSVAHASRAPSLFELSLRTITSMPFSAPLSLLPLLPPDAPDSVVRALHTVDEAKQDDGKKCSVCGKGYVIHRTEWIEWWHCVPDSLVTGLDAIGVPFLRRGCGVRCSPYEGKLWDH